MRLFRARLATPMKLSQVCQKKILDHEIIVMLGDDQISQIQKWKFSRQLIEEYSILVLTEITSKNSSDSSLIKSLKSNIKSFGIHYTLTPQQR